MDVMGFTSQIVCIKTKPSILVISFQRQRTILSKLYFSIGKTENVYT